MSDPHRADGGNKGGRPPSRSTTPQQLLDEFELHAAAQHRLRLPLSKESFCDAIGRTKPTLKHYLDGFGFLWPLVPPDRLVALCEAEHPYELLWVSRSLCDRLDYQRQELLYKPWLEAFRPDQPPSGEVVEHLERLRQGCAEAWDIRDTHFCSSDGRRLEAHSHVRYGPESDAFYVQIEPLGELHAPPSEEAEILNVEPGVRWVMHPVRDGQSQVVRLESLQTLLAWLESRRQTY